MCEMHLCIAVVALKSCPHRLLLQRRTVRQNRKPHATKSHGCLHGRDFVTSACVDTVRCDFVASSCVDKALVIGVHAFRDAKSYDWALELFIAVLCCIAECCIVIIM